MITYVEESIRSLIEGPSIFFTQLIRTLNASPYRPAIFFGISKISQMDFTLLNLVSCALPTSSQILLSILRRNQWETPGARAVSSPLYYFLYFLILLVMIIDQLSTEWNGNGIMPVNSGFIYMYCYYLFFVVVFNLIFNSLAVLP